MKKFFDYKSFTKQQWIALGVAGFLAFCFLVNEYQKRAAIDEATRGLDNILKKDKEITCKFLRERGDWAAYDKECKTS